ncbi:Glucose 1-dehydrogenase A [Nitrolancea hollandica Lb]|uniref:Glucose 1-dehydrogenase A n=2 Tax=Nitrolancea hollandica TaxID=1206749 RepID=I4END8_9BACT|nr:Glucose 1-dehydrogenase A [Nitrolancea hollandica Lb]
MTLTGKIALVTGSSSGIGRAIAIRLARDGCDVCVNYHGDQQGGEDTKQRIEKLGRRAINVQANVGKADEIRALVQRCITDLGGLDIMVNNAGIEIPNPILEVTEAQWDLVIDVTLKGVFLGLQEAARHMVRRGWGRIITISSIHEDATMPGNAPYCAAKGGVRMLTRTAAVELAPHGITVNNVAPGAIATPINQKTLVDPDAVAALIAEIPLARLGNPEDVAGVVAFLASDDAAYVTGSTYVVDGGMIRKRSPL